MPRDRILQRDPVCSEDGPRASCNIERSAHVRALGHRHLHRMEEAGWIRAEWVTKETGRRARLYELTAAGKKQLGMEESRWQAVTLAVNRVLREA